MMFQNGPLVKVIRSKSMPLWVGWEKWYVFSPPAFTCFLPPHTQGIDLDLVTLTEALILTW